MSTSLLPRIGHLWEDICGYIIRPQRAEYDPEELGPEVFRLSKDDKRQFRREDLILENMRGLNIRCTWFYPNHKGSAPPTPLPVVVYLHGNCGCRCDALEILHILAKGFTLFCYDACGSGMSDGDYVTLGFYERQDLATVIEYITESKKATSIGLWGRSMGAVTAIMYAARDPSIKALVLDSPFSQLRRLIFDLVKQHASMMPEAWTLMAVKKIRKKIAKIAQFDIDDLDAVKYGMQCTVPTFIFHGEDDDFVLPYHSELIAEHYLGMCFHHRVDGGHNSFRKSDVMNVAIPHLELYLITKPEDEKMRKMEANRARLAAAEEEEKIRRRQSTTAAEGKEKKEESGAMISSKTTRIPAVPPSPSSFTGLHAVSPNLPLASVGCETILSGNQNNTSQQQQQQQHQLTAPPRIPKSRPQQGPSSSSVLLGAGASSSLSPPPTASSPPSCGPSRSNTYTYDLSGSNSTTAGGGGGGSSITNNAAADEEHNQHHQTQAGKQTREQQHLKADETNPVASPPVDDDELASKKRAEEAVEESSSINAVVTPVEEKIQPPVACNSVLSTVGTATTDEEMGGPSECKAEDEQTDDDEEFERQYMDVLLSVRNMD